MTADLSSLDLNLLLVLDALLRERSVTRAGRRLGLAQSSTSHALARLRDALGDPLLVRSGRGMRLTPRAEALHGPLARLLGELSTLLSDGGAFSPETSGRRFVLSAPDLLAPLLPDLLRHLAARAPAVQLEVRGPLGPGLVEGLDQGVDLALATVAAGHDSLRMRGLSRLPWAVALRAGHPALEREWTVQTWTGWPHVEIRAGGAGPNLVAAALAAAGHERRVGLVLPTFLSAPLVVAGTDLMLNAPAPLLAPLVDRLGLVLRAPPLPLPDVPVAALWHPRLQADPGHQWFRAQVVAALEPQLAHPRPGGQG
ncbi:MAG: LysR family transcriptional regulator [Alphaproteobacteria bacterium]|nr:LysR family transcriptional regulator [Alphaproteobacteria bacterium]